MTSLANPKASPDKRSANNHIPPCMTCLAKGEVGFELLLEFMEFPVHDGNVGVTKWIVRQNFRWEHKISATLKTF